MVSNRCLHTRLKCFIHLLYKFMLKHDGRIPDERCHSAQRVYTYGIYRKKNVHNWPLESDENVENCNSNCREECKRYDNEKLKNLLRRMNKEQLVGLLVCWLCSKF